MATARSPDVVNISSDDSFIQDFSSPKLTLPPRIPSKTLSSETTRVQKINEDLQLHINRSPTDVLKRYQGQALSLKGPGNVQKPQLNERPGTKKFYTEDSHPQSETATAQSHSESLFTDCDGRKSPSLLSANKFNLPLPGSLNFAKERAEAVKRKKLFSGSSPFNGSKYDISPFKNSMNKPMFYKSPKKASLNSPRSWSPSPIDDGVTEHKEDALPSSGFIKSSLLLGKKSPSLSKTSTSELLSLPKPVPKKRTCEVISSQDSEFGARPKQSRTSKSYAWPSSSESSDSDDLLMSFKTKKVKKKSEKVKERGNLKISRAGSTSSMSSVAAPYQSCCRHSQKEHQTKRLKHTKRGGPIVYLDNEESVSKDKHCDMPIDIEKSPCFCNKISSSHHTALGSGERATNQLFGKTSFDKFKKHENRQLKSKSSMCTTRDLLSPVLKRKKLGSSLHVSSPNVSKSLQSKKPTRLSSSFSSGNSFTPRSPSFTSRSHTFSPENQLIQSKSDSEPDNPELSSGSPVFARQSKFIARESVEPAAVLASATPLATASSTPSLPRTSLFDKDSANKAGSQLGSEGNPIEIDRLTPETKKALAALQQVEKDEEIARKIQEELDMEFAMSLQNGRVSPAFGSSTFNDSCSTQSSFGTSSELTLDSTGASLESPQQWHIHSPARHGGQRRRDNRNRRRNRDSVPEEEVLNLLRNTYESVFRGNDNATPFDLLWTQYTYPQPHRGRARGGRRNRWWGIPVHSPGGNGEDYEQLMNLAEIIGDVKDKGLSKADLVRLPVVTYKKTTVVEECNICMTDYEDGDSQKILPCFHSYHATCIDKWIQKNATCPVCRVEVKVTSP